ncbi:rhodanese-like domain-containing protein [Modestobacter muralis]|uniref:rhodanese-like domain-containing protein n=1 Tax=Modestobacter muralis TaxID=1608614 RepID=UPI001B8C1DDB
MLTTRKRSIALVLLAAGVATAACSGGEPTGGATAGDAVTAARTAASPRQADPAQFATAVGDPRTFAINVHVPDAGSIPGTDVAIPYDQIQMRAAQLPRDRSTPLAVYCRSGRMSAEALPVLTELGYTDVVELSGGMDAWVADGRELLPPVG